jgi:hypothetical protein
MSAYGSGKNGANVLEKTNVILALGTGFYGEAVREELRRSDEIDVVAEVASPLELLRLSEVHEADAVIIETVGESSGYAQSTKNEFGFTNELAMQDQWRKASESNMPGVLTHMFEQFPRILAIVLDPEKNSATIYRQQIREQVLDGVSLSEMLCELSNADSDYWMRA